VTRVRIGRTGWSVGDAVPTWGERAETSDPLLATARALLPTHGRLGQLGRGTVAALVAVRIALQDGARPVSLVVVAQDGSLDADRSFWQTARDAGGAYASPMLFPATLPSSAAGEIARAFDVRGPCVVLAGDAEVIAVPGGGPRLVVRILHGGDVDVTLDPALGPACRYDPAP
jgi:hypothetical protein